VNEAAMHQHDGVIAIEPEQKGDSKLNGPRRATANTTVVSP
jgi:hypothetical protein